MDTNTKRWQDRESRWTSMLAEAEALPIEEVKRHALVSLRNNHRCRECFTCACATALLAFVGATRVARVLH